ncbi:MAG: hypothetical protein GX442_21075 [Candidatus Riflebacteria bacterium]|nr:hypothetical protein [Candidatus Riflebacteria bacterium]
MNEGTSDRGPAARRIVGQSIAARGFARLMAEAWVEAQTVPRAGAARAGDNGGPPLAEALREAVLATLRAGWEVFLFLDGLVSRDWAEFPEALTGLTHDPLGAVLMDLFAETTVFTLCRLHYQRAQVNLVATVGAAALPRFLNLEAAIDLSESDRSCRLAELKAAITAGLASGHAGRPKADAGE